MHLFLPTHIHQGFIVIETNFRLYAYSTSKLHCEILRLFARYANNLLLLLVFLSVLCLSKETIWEEQVLTLLLLIALPGLCCYFLLELIPSQTVSDTRLVLAKKCISCIICELGEDVRFMNLHLPS